MPVLVFEPNNIESAKLALKRCRKLVLDLEQQLIEMDALADLAEHAEAEEKHRKRLLKQITVIRQLQSGIEQHLIESADDLDTPSTGSGAA